MDRTETLNRIQNVFRDVFADQKLGVSEQTGVGDIPMWDSLANIGLIFALEQEFHVKFALGEIPDLKSAGAMADIIRKHQANGVTV